VSSQFFVPYLVLWAALMRALLVRAKIAPSLCRRCGLKLERSLIESFAFDQFCYAALRLTRAGGARVLLLGLGRRLSSSAPVAVLKHRPPRQFALS
jgi:hypothetical protein